MFEKLIIKFISQSANIDDLNRLMKFLDKKKNLEIFKSYIETNYYSIYAMQNFDKNDILEVVQKRILDEKRKISRKQTLKKLFKYAAILTVFFGLGYYYNSFQIQNKTEFIIPHDDDIVLTTSDGKNIILKEEHDVVQVESKVTLKKNSGQLIYNKISKINYQNEKPIVHTIKVPHGKKFKILLSDGTLVHLNSGSKLKYPVSFDENKPRVVFLQGEAYFNVAERINQVFTVNTKTVNVEVYGTEFNFKNYPEDGFSDVVLVHGSIGLYSKFNQGITMLKPSTIGSFDNTDYSIRQKKINTSVYTSWIDGVIVFRNESFDNIISKLERIYNVEIIYNGQQGLNETFNAKININEENINQVLSYFNKIHKIKYQTFNNKIIIN
jgi:hypothetical protein